MGINRVRESPLKLIEAVNKFEPDVIMLTLGHLNLILLLLKLFFTSKPRMVIREANVPSAGKKKGLLSKRSIFNTLKNILYPRADCIVAQCIEMKEEIISHYKINPDKVIHIYNPVDTSYIKEQSNQFNPYIGKKVNIVAVGRLSYQKAFDNLINAMPKVIEEYPYIRQKEPKGLGHAIHCVKSFIGDEPFAVLLGDDIVHNEKPCLKQMIEAYDKYKTSILGVQEVADEDVCKYGIVDGKHIEGRIYTVKDLVEKQR